jgi:hypothetical protein
MIEGSQDFCFALETSKAFGIAREGVGQNFYGHGTIEFGIARFVNFAHATGAERRLNLVRA